MSLLDAMAREYGREVFGDGNVMPESVARVVTNGLRAALAEARKQGFVLVPVEPTKEMVHAFWNVPGTPVRHYQEMISASPSLDEV